MKLDHSMHLTRVSSCQVEGTRLRHGRGRDSLNGDRAGTNEMQRIVNPLNASVRQSAHEIGAPGTSVVPGTYAV